MGEPDIISTDQVQQAADTGASDYVVWQLF